MHLEILRVRLFLRLQSRSLKLTQFDYIKHIRWNYSNSYTSTGLPGLLLFRWIWIQFMAMIFQVTKSENNVRNVTLT